MKTDTLTGPNLSYWSAVVYGCTEVETTMFYEKVVVTCLLPHAELSDADVIFDYADPATFQPIAEREFIDSRYIGNGGWRATTHSKKKLDDSSRYQPKVSAWGDTEAEARMRCYVKSYLGDDTKGD